MELHFIDTKASERIYKSYKSHMKPKECYTNIFFLLSKNYSMFESGEWRIAYGFISSLDCIYCRRCFIIEHDGKVIDPTVYAHERDNSETTYFVMKVFENIDDYIAALNSENNYPSLGKYLRKEEMKAQRWATDNGYLFIG